MALAPSTILGLDRQGTWSERIFAGRTPSPWRPRTHGFLQPPGRRSRRAKRRIGRVLKWTVRGLYLSPGLLLATIILRLGDLPGGEILTAIFVCVVVIFFALLNLYIVASVVAFRVGQKGSPRLRLPFSEAGDDALGLLTAEARAVPHVDQAPSEADALIRGRGTVVELTPRIARGQPVVRDLWLPEATRSMRLTEMVAFAVVAPDRQPLIVSAAHAPALLLPPERHDLFEALPQFAGASQDLFAQHLRFGDTGDDTLGWMLPLRDGDEVEILGTVIETVDDVQEFVLDGEERAVPKTAATRAASPYRHGRRARGIILGGSEDRPLVIRRL